MSYGPDTEFQAILENCQTEPLLVPDSGQLTMRVEFIHDEDFVGKSWPISITEAVIQYLNGYACFGAANAPIVTERERKLLLHTARLFEVEAMRIRAVAEYHVTEADLPDRPTESPSEPAGHGEAI
jgi:hypothetical protein